MTDSCLSQYVVEGVLMLCCCCLGVISNIVSVVFFLRQREHRTFHRSGLGCPEFQKYLILNPIFYTGLCIMALRAATMGICGNSIENVAMWSRN